jgi:hypothetical protein
MEHQLTENPPVSQFRVATELKKFFMFNEPKPLVKKAKGKGKARAEPEIKLDENIGSEEGGEIVIDITTNEKTRWELHEEVRSIKKVVKDFLKPTNNQTMRCNWTDHWCRNQYNIPTVIGTPI